MRFTATAFPPVLVWRTVSVNPDTQRSWRKRGLVAGVARDGRRWRYDLWDVARFVVLDRLSARERARHAEIVTIAASRIADVILWDQVLWTIVGDAPDFNSLRASLYRERGIPIEATRRYLLTLAPGQYEFTDDRRLRAAAPSAIDLDLLAAQMKTRLRGPVMRVEL